MTQSTQPVDNSEPAWTPPKPTRPITRKELAFTTELINNPKISGTQAALRTYNTKSPVTAANIASTNLRKPQVLAELAKHSATAELSLLEVLDRSKEMMRKDIPRAVDWAVNTRQTADSIMDRVHGKATQKVEQHTTTVTLSLSLKDITSPTDDHPN